MTGRGAPEVAVLVPARNEAESIARCLRHVLAQDLELDRLEVVVVDGDSTDGTGEIAAEILRDAGVARWEVHRNVGGSTPSNLNAGLRLVQAPITCRVDARSLVPSGYVRTCLELLQERPEVAVVGGAQVAVARSGSDLDRGIARALNNRYGMGMSRYRRGATSGPADTVYLGAFRTADLRSIGGWDERFTTNQDFDLNRRMSERGTVWFEDTLEVEYLPRDSLGGLWNQYHRFGRWKVRYWRSTGDRPRPRQLALVAVPVVGALLLSALVVVPGRRGRRAALVAVAASLGAVAVDGAGSGLSEATVRQRAWSIASSFAVASGWLSGVARELVEG